MRAAWWTPPSEATAPVGRSCRRALAYPPHSYPIPAVHHISVGDHMAQAGEYDPGVPQTKSAPGFGRRAYLDDLSTPPTGGPLRSPRPKSTICASRTYEVPRGISPCVTEIACHSLTLCRSGKSQLETADSARCPLTAGQAAQDSAMASFPAQPPGTRPKPWICVPPAARAKPHSNACAAANATPVAILCCCTLGPAVRIISDLWS